MKDSKSIVALFSVLMLWSCVNRNPKISDVSNNKELEQLVVKDQEMRNNDTLDMEPIDKMHRHQVMELLADGQVITGQDKFNAALILQHTALTFCNEKLVSISPENYYLAYKLSKSAFESGYKNAGNMTAATYDRYLLYTEGYQKYGTQRIYDEKTEEEYWAPIDSNTTDEERAIYMVKPLKKLLKEYKIQPFKKEKGN